MSKEVWRSCSLESIAQLVSGRTPEREQKEYYADQGTPWVKIENLNQGVITKTTEYLSEKGREKVNLVPEGSVLFSIVGTVGKVGIAGRELATNQQIVALIFDEEKILPKYGYYCMVYHAAKIRNLSNQTTMALISRKTLGQYRIVIPESLNVQAEIVEKLEKFESLVWKKEVQMKEMLRLEKFMFQRCLGKEVRYHETLPMKQFLCQSIKVGLDSKKELPQEQEILLRNGRLSLVDKTKQVETYFEDRSVLRILPEKKKLLPEVLYGYLNQDELEVVLYGERKAGENRKRPIRASELERLEIPYFSMKKQQVFAELFQQMKKIQVQIEEEKAYTHRIFRASLRQFLEEPLEEECATRQEETCQTIEEKKPMLRDLMRQVVQQWEPEDQEQALEYKKQREILLQRGEEEKELLLFLLSYVKN